MQTYNGIARYLDDDKKLILYNVGVEDFSGDNVFAIANGWPERDIKGIDGLTIIADGTVNLRGNADALLLNDCETTIIGNLNLKTSNGQGIIMGGDATLNLLDASLSIETPSDKYGIVTEGKGEVNIDHSELYLTGAGIYGLNGLNLDGSYFADGSSYDGSSYNGNVAIKFDKETTKEFRIKNGDKKTGELLLATVVMTSFDNGTDYMYNPVLTCKKEGGIEYYYRASDNKLLFTCEGITFHLAPDPEDISAPTYSIKSGLLPTLEESFSNDYQYYWSLVNRYNTWKLHFMPEAATDIESISEQPTADTWYTIGGQKITGQPTHKGIYIKNGQKVTIK